MITLTVNRNQLDYLGTFEKPAFNLMGEVRCVLEGLFKCFSAYQPTLADFRIEDSVSQPANSGVNVFLRSLGNYKLRFDRVEWTVLNFEDRELMQFPELLGNGERWLRSATQGISFSSHIFSYVAHCKLSSGTAKEFLLSRQSERLINSGELLGNGIIYNWFDGEIKGKCQLVIDHSLIVKDGLWIQLSTTIEEDEIDHSSVIKVGETAINEALTKIGLRLETEQEVG
jgi:hypothetical protein